MLWFWASLLAAILWGISYAFAEQTLKSGISSATLMAFYTWIALPVFTLAAWQDKSLQTGITIVKNSPKLLFFIPMLVVLYFCGNCLIYWAVNKKNATSVSMIEISYPFFVALFSLLLFQQNHLTLGTVLGGMLIFSGVAVMYFVK